MKVKMSEVIGSTEALGALSQKALPAATAFKVARLSAAIKQPLQDFDSVRMKLLDEVGEKVEGSDQFKIKDPDRWNSEMKALVEQEVEVPDETLTLDDFGKAEVEPRVLSQLSWFVKL